ncbi:hypothetical protein ACH4U3_00365 [Streptomyces griseoruber]|uniref:hypothetical protein n=1 Tax=Streptomyces griseoruber TaxID=1943 RepID=UPI0037BB9F51
MPTPDELWKSADLTTRRLAGLALNPATPPDILLRLLLDGPLAVRTVLCGDRALPEVVADAVITHPDHLTRRFFAGSVHADPAQRARLVDDPDWTVRAWLANGPLPTGPHRPRPLPDTTVVRMISTYDNEQLGGGIYRQFSNELRRAMPTHPDPKVRAWGVGMWTWLSAERRAALLADPDDEVRGRAERHRQDEDPAWVESNLPDRPCHARTYVLVNLPLTRSVVDSVLTAPAGPQERSMIAGNASLPSDVVVLLASDPDPEVREEIARRDDLGPDELRALAVDPEPKVRLAVSVHPAWSEEERAGIDYAVPLDRTFGPHFERLYPRDPEAVRRDALSGHPLLRRRAATERGLPPDLVALLGADDDLGVRVLLAQNHPDAPPDLLLRSFLEYTGLEREHLLTRPAFPTDGLAEYADHADPAVRALAARDPETPSEVVDRLTRDPDAGVRAAFARHPRLPPARLAELLDDEELVRDAAANPALGVDAVRRLVAAMPVS